MDLKIIQKDKFKKVLIGEEKEENLETDTVQIPVYTSEHVQKGVFFTECDTPYLAVELKGTIAITTGCHRSAQEIHKIIENAEKKWKKIRKNMEH